MALGRDEALAIQRRALRDFIRLLAASAPGSRLHELPGVSAAIVPACPRRSIVNSVAFDSPAALVGSLDGLAGAYEEAGVEAWTVWVPDFDRETTVALERAGHRFDGAPAAMALELERFEPRDLDGLDWDAAGDPATIGPLNDLAYGHAGGDGFAAGFAAPPTELVRLYQARAGGEVACVLATMDHGGEDLGFYFVATHPQHRGRGLATRLMAAALAEARGRGMRTSSLQASAMGEPVYWALGFESYFSLHMYERRQGQG